MRTYIVKLVDEVTQAMIDICLEDSFDTLRKSNDGTECILKWEGADPLIFDNETKYTHSGIMVILEGEDWQSEMIL